ncbi:DUF4198 domain-containing protein [Pelagibacterium halotolerans]|uniref:DUF4198 domain-containing protein n=1 Tax=Pelagibacterium halotolerans TaxID=531813 RepID=UPI001FCC6242|nr:DUF4198 domain-containing protein [Pelagibacterium halotolerans]
MPFYASFVQDRAARAALCGWSVRASTCRGRVALKSIIRTLFLATALCATPAMAHFQTLYTPDLTPDAPADIRVKAIFWHPFIGGPNVDMPFPLEAYAINRGERIDLMPSLSQVTFAGPDNQALAFDLTVPVRRAGDYVTVLVGEAYFDEAAQLLIQPYVKMILNAGGLPSDWDVPVGLPAEIVPMTKPYNVMSGSTFSARVLRDGEPLPGHQVEIVYLNAVPDMEANRSVSNGVVPPDGGVLVATTDDNGVFTVGLPRAGYWGFGALAAGPAFVNEDHVHISQDAILWVEVVPF